MKRALTCAALAAAMTFATVADAQSTDPIGDLIGRLAARIGALETFALKATLYVTSGHSKGRDSIGCRVIPMRTAAVDGVSIPRHTVLFIKETVGLRMPDGRLHDGYWYATDLGSAIVPGRIDLYTGEGHGSLRPLMPLNLRTLTVSKVGAFAGCPDEAHAPILADTGAAPTPAQTSAG